MFAGTVLVGFRGSCFGADRPRAFRRGNGRPVRDLPAGRRAGDRRVHRRRQETSRVVSDTIAKGEDALPASNQMAVVDTMLCVGGLLVLALRRYC